MTEVRMPWWRRTIARMVASESEIDDSRLREDVAATGSTPVTRCEDRERVSVHGTLRSVTMHPREDLPRLQAKLYDGTGEIDLVWIGRRRIQAIEPGRSLTAHGRVLLADGRRTIYNPRYELDPVSAR